MNLDMNPTTEQLRELLAACNDRAGNHLLWVKKTGEVEITRLPRKEDPANFESAHPEMQVRYALFLVAHEYVGEDAAKDDDWVQELFGALMRDWQAAKGKSEVAFAGELW